MGHCLPDHQGGCYRPHGHRYRLEVTLEEGMQSAGAERGMVMDFGNLKTEVERRVIETLDHRFVMALDDPRFSKMRDAFPEPRHVLGIEGPPTAENLVLLIAGVLDHLPVVELRLWETPTCSATWRRDD